MGGTAQDANNLLSKAHQHLSEGRLSWAERMEMEAQKIAKEGEFAIDPLPEEELEAGRYTTTEGPLIYTPFFLLS